MSVFGLVAMLAAIALLGWLLSTMFRNPQPADAWRVAGTPLISVDAKSFYMNYIRRHTNFRRFGAVTVGALSILGSIIAYQSVILWGNSGNQSSTECSGNMCTTYSSVPPTATMMSMLVPACVLGAILGGLLAETYRLRPPTGLLVASLDARQRRPMIRRAYAAWVVTGLAIGVGTAAQIAYNTSQLLIGLLPGLLAVCLAEVVQFAVTSRRRPVLSDDAMTADRNMRRAVSESVTWLELGAATLCLGWAAMAAGSLLQGTDHSMLSNNLGAVLVFAGFFSVIPALVFVHRSSLVKPPSQNPVFNQPAPSQHLREQHLAITRWFKPSAGSQ